MRFFEFTHINLRSPKPAADQPIPAKPVPEPLKREWLRKNLTAQVTRQANIPQVTQDDLRVAVQDFETEQKRANLEFRKAAEQKQRQHQRVKRRRAENRGRDDDRR